MNFELPDCFYETNFHELERLQKSFLQPDAVLRGKFTKVLLYTIALNVYCCLKGVPRSIRRTQWNHPIQPTSPWGLNPFFNAEISHLSYDFPGSNGYHILRDKSLCDEFGQICKSSKDVVIEKGYTFDVQANIGDVVLIGDSTHLHYAATITNIQGGKPYSAHIVKNPAFKSSATKIEIVQNSKYRPPPNKDTVFIYRTKTGVFMVKNFKTSKTYF